MATHLLLIPVSKASEFYEIDSQQPISYRDGCHLAHNEYEPKTCFYGDLTAKRTIYLVGDSHAAQWLPGFIDFGIKQGWRIKSITKSGCPAAFMPMYEECLIWNDELIKEVAMNKPEMVFISNLTNNMHQLVKNSKYYNLYYRDGFSKMVLSLVKYSQVSVIEDTPFPNFDVVNCLRNPPIKGCDFSNTPNSLTLLSRVITRKYQSNWIGTYSDFCHKKNCSAVFQGKNMYRDHSHISTFASNLFARNFLEETLDKT